MFEKAFHLPHGLMTARPATGQRQGIAGQIASLDQIAEQGVDDQHGDFAAGGTERTQEGPPVGTEAGRLLPAPALAGLGIGEEGFVENAVLAGEAGQGFAAFQQRPQQQALGFLAVVAQGLRRVVKLGQPGLDGFQVVAGGQLTDHVRPGAIAAGAAVEFVGQAQPFQR